MSKKTFKSKKEYDLKIVVEMKAKVGIVYKEIILSCTAMDLAALKHRLKVFRTDLRKKLKEKHPGALLQRMDFFLSDGTKVLAKGKDVEKQKRQEEAKQGRRNEDRRIASGKFTITEDQ